MKFRAIAQPKPNANSRTVVIELAYHPRFETTAPLPFVASPHRLQGAGPELQRRHEAGKRGLGMGVWKRARVFNWELAFWISALVLAFITIGALLTYQSYGLAGR